MDSYNVYQPVNERRYRPFLLMASNLILPFHVPQKNMRIDLLNKKTENQSFQFTATTGSANAEIHLWFDG